MAYESPYVDVEDLTLFAITSGGFYQNHLALAKRNATYQGWTQHIKRTVWPAYLREVDACGIIMMHDIERVAVALRAYYRDHLAEIA